LLQEVEELEKLIAAEREAAERKDRRRPRERSRERDRDGDRERERDREFDERRESKRSRGDKDRWGGFDSWIDKSGHLGAVWRLMTALKLFRREGGGVIHYHYEDQFASGFLWLWLGI